MTVGEIIKKLEKAENYALVRIQISDEFIKMVKEMLPDAYERIEEKENTYIEMRLIFGELIIKQ